MKWKPMSKAPKDRDVLIWNPVTGAYRSRFTENAEEGCEWPMHFWERPGLWYPAAMKWAELPSPEAAE